MKKRIIAFFILLFIFVFVSGFTVHADNKCTVEGGYYGVYETLEDINLEYGLSNINYKHENAYSCITDASRIIGYECGGATYSNKALELNKEYSQNSFVLTIPKESNTKIVSWACVNNGTWSLSTILQTAKDYEEKHPGYKVIAGVNGDFFDINADNDYPYTVIGTMVADGETYKVENTWPAITFKNDNSDKPIDKIDAPQYKNKPTLSIYNDKEEVIYTFDIDKINEENSGDEISLYYGLYQKQEKYHNMIPIDVSDAYIVKDENARTVPFSINSFYGKGVITNYGADTLKTNEFAIKTNNQEVLNKIKIGTLIRVQYDLLGELQGANNVSGGVATFLKNSEHAELDHYDYMQYRYPRTLVGYTKDGDVIFTVTDGRQSPKGYYGLNGVESAAQMKYYGCVEAYCFDGGGSSTMVILKDGELTCVNNPSDGSLRRDGNAILIVTRVEKLDLSYTSNTSSIEINLQELEEIDGYDDYFISLNNQMVAIVDGKAKFENLETNTAYKYIVYIKNKDKYNQMPYSGTCYTQKAMFEIEDMRIIKVDDNYEIKVKIKDDNEAIVTSAFILNDTRISKRSGKYSISKDKIDLILSKLKDGYFSISYELSLNDEREEAKIVLDKINFEDADTAISAIADEISSIVDGWM